MYDVLIVGASFAGLTLAHHLPSSLKVLIIDAKPEAGSTVESTGLITVRTKEEFSSFIEIDRFITNPIRSITVVAPDMETRFTSSVVEPWIYQTDTKALVKHLADTLPKNVTFLPKTVFLGTDHPDHPTHARLRTMHEAEQLVPFRFLVGADGGRSKVAEVTPKLSRNTSFLFGYEQVFFGRVIRGEYPEETIYHYWFGAFSLGYGGWLSPTVVDGKPAFRIGLAKLAKDRGDAKGLMERFIADLIARGDIQIEGEPTKPGYVFGSLIPIGGTRRRIHHHNVLLLGDAAGFCGAFAADGIKGAIISAKEAAPRICATLAGDRTALRSLKRAIQSHDHLISCYHRQRLYRRIWDLMRRNRTFFAMYRIIEREQATFLAQFCDSKDKHVSLAWTVLKIKHLPALVRYGGCLMVDLLKR